MPVAHHGGKQISGMTAAGESKGIHDKRKELHLTGSAMTVIFPFGFCGMFLTGYSYSHGGIGCALLRGSKSVPGIRDRRLVKGQASLPRRQVRLQCGAASVRQWLPAEVPYRNTGCW